MAYMLSPECDARVYPAASCGRVSCTFPFLLGVMLACPPHLLLADAPLLLLLLYG